MSTRGFRLLRAAARLAERLVAIDPILPALERRMLPPRGDEPVPVLLLAGPPRSGTTLLFDLVTSAWPTSYPTNLASLLHRSPLLAWRLVERAARRRGFSGESRYGLMNGIGAPSEARALMTAWFGPLDEPRLPAPVARATVRATVAGLARAGGPLVIKNLGLALRPERVHAVLPEALIVRMRRDPLETARSLLVARRALNGDERTWFGVRPPACPWLDELEPAEQIAWQIRLIEASIDAACALHGPGRFHAVAMDGLRRSPGTVMDEIGAFCDAAGVPLGARVDRAGAASPRAGSSSNLDAAAMRRLEAALARVEQAPLPAFETAPDG